MSSVAELVSPRVHVAQARGSIPESQQHQGNSELPDAYLSYLSELRSSWVDLPDLTITYKDFGYTTKVPSQSGDIPSVLTSWRDAFNVFRDRSKDYKDFHALKGACGVVRPGELTLILAPPGHGKSTLLKGLAGRLQRESSNLRGEVRWNGLTSRECAESGFQLAKYCAFVEQGDIHFPMLTVRETFEFALRNSNSDLSGLGNTELNKMQAKKVELVLELLGLKECADTVVGNALLRGVSGGQKKRVTLGEMMITQARALFLDEISTGLDAAATFDIVCSLKRWTRLMSGSAYVALLQPSPEVMSMFDNIILLREGVTLFNGSQAQLRAHFDAMHIEPNEEVDFADWLTEFVTDPIEVWKRDTERRFSHKHSSFRRSFRQDSQQLDASMKPATTNGGVIRSEVAYENTERVVFHLEHELPHVITANDQPGLSGNSCKSPDGKQKALGQIISAAGIPLTTVALRKSFEDSAVHLNTRAEIDTVNNQQRRLFQNKDVSRSELTLRQYYQRQSKSWWYHTMTCVQRQWVFTKRSPDFVVPHLVQGVVMGLIMGSLFYQLGTGVEDFSARIGLILFALLNVSFGNMAEVPLASEFKLVVFKQVDAGMYTPLSYYTSVLLMHIPLAAAEMTIFGSILYWMTGFASDAGRFFFFLLLFFMMNITTSNLFRTLSYISSNAAIAANLAGPITANLMVFGGFLITYDKIPDYAQWLYWLSPFSWALTSGAQNEFASDRYPPGVGDTYLGVWQIKTDSDYKWAGIGYNLLCFILFFTTAVLALTYKREWLSRGTLRSDEKEEERVQENVQVRVGTRSMQEAAANKKVAEEGNQLDFKRMTLSWRNLKYTVQVLEQDDSGKQVQRDRVLLDGINGFARAGELVALMGSSGAGKTTLMDVIAGRKTTGKVEGEIFVNGHPQTFPSFTRLNSYCEQTDIHLGTDTVREAIEFSAKLRLPSDVSVDARRRFVDQILEDLELTDIANRLIGDANIIGLSPGQLKRVTIGVELAANPNFLFLDEPTSGLDSRAALLVCKVIQKIARRGRSVICTIHQPSAELFTMFDRLLLLKSGGKEVYFGPVGEDGEDLVQYFMNAEIDANCFRPPIGEQQNPANWMLDVIGAGTSAKGKIADYSEVYKVSSLRQDNMSTLTHLCEVKGEMVQFDQIYAAPYLTQYWQVQRRMFAMYWRDSEYQNAKFILMIVLGLLFGLIWRNMNTDDEQGLTSLISVMFTTAAFMGVVISSNALPAVYRLREVFYRERASNVYSPFMYSISLAIVELPWVFTCVMIVHLPYYFLVGFENSGQMFFRYVFVMFLNAIFWCYMGQFFGTVMPNIQVANLIQGVMYTFFFLFAGIFIQKKSIPTGWTWMYYLDPLPKVTIALASQQLYCNKDEQSCDTIFSSRLGGQVTKWEFTKEYLSTAGNFEGYYIGWLCFTIVVMHLAFALAVRKVSHVKR